MISKDTKMCALSASIPKISNFKPKRFLEANKNYIFE
jgi:hypothetical protein